MSAGRRVAAGLLILLAVVLAARALDAPALLRQALEHLRDLGPWGLALFVVLYVAATVLLVPASILTLGAGAVFGLGRGLALVSVAATLGATAAFLVGRYVAREAIERRLAAQPRFAAVDAAVAREGWKIVVLTRLSPALPFVLLNYAFGLTRVPLRDYVLASWLGMLPGTALYVYLGSLAGDLATLGAGPRTRTPAEWTAYVVGLLATIAVTAQVTRLARGALRRRIGAAALAALLVATAGPAAADDGAYARLLERHVRPGVVAGIRLALVDYAALREDADYPRALQALAAVDAGRLGAGPERLAFWINAYNLLALKAVADRYPLASLRDGGNLLRPIWKRPIGRAAGRERTLDEIEHDILRRDFREPRMHFAIVCASLSCPDLRREPYAAARLEAQLSDATRAFLGNPGKGVQAGPDGRTARVSSIFRWFAEDFGGPEGVVRFVRATADPALAARLARLDTGGLDYLPYDWSLNDARRAARR
jgi:uncharacterized membrane protein YdjX (TVP38/TMEM64 family)